MLTPWSRDKSAPIPRPEDQGRPLMALHQEVNRLFDDFLRGFSLPSGRLGWTNGWPQVDMADTGKEIRLMAELPGMDEKDIELTLQDGLLTLKGEKKAETEGPQYSERWHGAFQRSFQLGPDIDPEKVTADFKNGVLTITVAKKPEEQRAAKRISIKS